MVTIFKWAWNLLKNVRGRWDVRADSQKYLEYDLTQTQKLEMVVFSRGFVLSVIEERKQILC